MTIASPTDKALLRDITVILIIKLVLLFTIWQCFFSDETVTVTSETLSNTLFTDTAAGAKE